MPVGRGRVDEAGLAGMSISWLTVGTPLPSGPMQVTVTPAGVVATGYAVSETGPQALPCTDQVKIDAVTGRITEYLAGERREPGLPLDWSRASGPHLVVLRTLLAEVPYGKTITYGELAARSGVFDDITEPGLAARTVGQMMAANPLPLLVPCHRVVAADGIGGFGGGRVGIDVKRWLLTLEGVLEPTLDWNGPDWSAV
ncbi:methylated-DNA--[protein]-cysteine S-methyltransferase [Kitasatospora sp. NPDC057223]|uniref:methylated-DNA--[protein]-cysteine S-methyltransferase n=1 Tax=Kitasatospora sp. NPDC057223 TaxID=3346055 RepID=UPI0036277B2E